MKDITALVRDAVAWREDRTDINEREIDGKYVNPGEWAASDDWAAAIADEVAALSE